MNLSKIKLLLANCRNWFCRPMAAVLLLIHAVPHAKADPRIDRDTATAPPASVQQIAAKAGDTLIAEQGVASWYGKHWRGRRTADGGRFDDRQLTAAHLWLPFATRARVTNLDNGRSVDVVVTDRGPYVGHRIIDLSAQAARVIGMRENGLAPVAIVAELTPRPLRTAQAW